MTHFAQLWKKYREMILYIVVGALTTALSFGIYGLLWKGLGIAWLANSVAWVGAVSFAFFANKLAVFGSRAMDARTLGRELFLFIGCRLGTGLFAMAFIGFSVDWLLQTEYAAALPEWYRSWHWLAMKFFAEAFETVANYLAGKFWIFARRKDAAQ
ncbi:MAG: GtrA family protein [Victivallaceae bacterium]|nr:GtrA family protein [Victivallaceae bacterium]